MQLIAEDLLELSDLLKAFGISRSTFYRMRREGAFPLPVQIHGSSRPRWRALDVRRWLDGLDTVKAPPKEAPAVDPAQILSLLKQLVPAEAQEKKPEAVGSKRPGRPKKHIPAG